jgi:hypothetical protein
MANKKRVNPHKRLATVADVNRAKNNATTEAIKRTIYMILYILIDKHDAPYEDIQTLAEEINYLADSIARNYVSWKDIEKVVIEEFKVELPW